MAISPYNRLRGVSTGSAVIPFSGLLDAYPDAAAAYSVRQLSSTYTAPTASEFSFGNALDFDGSNDYVDFTPITTGTTWCLSFWFQYNPGVLISTATPDKVQVYNSSNFRITTGANDNFYSVPVMSTSTWYHCYISVISGVCRLYFNGVQASTGTQNNSIDITSFANFPGGGFKFGGILDEVGLLVGDGGTAQDAIDLYNGGSGDYFNTVMGNSTAYWRFNETSGTTLTDETGNYNGTLNGFTVPGAWVNGKANNGALVEIRRESDDTAKSFYSDSNNELSLTSPDVNGVTLGTWIGAGDGFVRTWYDQSGNSIDFIQATTSEQPKIITAGAFTLESSKPVITFDGTDDYFNATLSAASTNAYQSLANYKALSVPTIGSTTIGSEGSNDKRYWYRDNTDSRIRNGGISEGVFTYLSSNSLVQIIYDGTTTVDVYENNSALETGTISGSSSTEEIWIGDWASTGRPMNFSLSEFIDWQDDDDSRVSGVKTNQNDYYNIYSPPGAFIIATGGTIEDDGDYKYHSFTSGTGTFEVTSLGSDPTYGDKIEYLVVAGGGGGGTLLGAGGGAGGLLTATNATVSATSYTATVGGGGAGATVERTRGGAGSDSTFYGVTAIGGGAGAANGAGNRDGGGGGSGGGAVSSGTSGAGTAGQGNEGGLGTAIGAFGQGGGGGAGAVGQDGTGTDGGDGGVGLSNSITGTAVYYAGGGGASAYGLGGGTAGEGGEGGGGDGGTSAGTHGTANTGGGGGGSDRDTVTPAGGNGGSGIVIVRYKFQ